MRILFLGGTGNISTACVELALERGHQVTLLNRGRSPSPFGERVQHVAGDRNDEALLARVAREGRYDAVADFVCFTPEQDQAAVRAFEGQVGQYLFISTASAYQKPPNHYLITESTPLRNPFWEYSRLKIACEDAFVAAYRAQGLPITIVRPSYTYGPTWIPSGVFGHGYTIVARMRRGLPVISHGDGQSLWVMTYNADFAVGLVGLLGNPRAIGEAYHITSDEVLTWDQIYRTIARAAGCAVELVHVPSQLIAAHYAEEAAGLLGDKAYSVVFDNSKIKAAVPEFRARVSFAEGMARAMAWHDADASRRVVDDRRMAMMDALIAVYRRAWPE